MTKGLLTLRRSHDAYLVKISIYDEKGKLVESKEYNNIGHIEIEECKRLTHHIALDSSMFVFVLTSEDSIILKEKNGILVVVCK